MRAGAWACSSALIACCLVTSVALGAAPERDSTRFRIELGAATDVTNEQYFEESYSDTTFQSRLLREVPEHRSAAVAAIEWTHRSASSGRSWWWRPELSIGDHVRRVSSTARWTHDDGLSSAWAVEPRVEWLEDESFGLDRREWRGGLSGQHRRRLGDSDRLELRLGGEWTETSGEDIVRSLDRRVARAGVRWMRMPLFGWEYGIRGSAEVRAFPDSVTRDHLETTWAAEARRPFGEAHQLSTEVALTHRGTLRSTASTRDRSWAPRAQVALDLRSAAAARLHWSAEGEAMRYATPDPAVYFDYELLRTRLELERDLGVGWALRAGPRLEWLLSGENATERYAESGAGLEFEQVARALWWSVGAEAGWRQYERETDTIIAAPGQHSSFAYYGLQTLLEWTVSNAWRARLHADARIEKHRDASQDGRSLYFSLDVRRLLAPS